MVNPIWNWWISSKLIYEEAEKIWLKCEVIEKEKNLFLISNTKKEILFKSSDCSINSSMWYKIAEDKHITYTLCERLWIPYPETLYFEDGNSEEIENVIKSLWFPLITKPYDGAHGDGVSIWINSRELLIKWYNFAKSYTNWKVIVQKQIPWLDHRILILWDTVIAWAIRMPPYVIGDWKKSIIMLVEEENTSQKRGWWDNHDSIRSKIRIDSEFYETLEKAGYTKDSILPKSEKVYVRRNSNLSTGWLSIDITDTIHRDTKKACVKLLQACWLWFAAVDIMTTDISKPLSETNGKIIEINATPGIRMHHFPSEGKSRNIAWELLRYLFF